MSDQKHTMIWAVVRRDRLESRFDPTEPQVTITLREAVPTREEAEAEAARLNEINGDGWCFYFAAPVRWFPNGRDVEVGY